MSQLICQRRRLPSGHDAPREPAADRVVRMVRGRCTSVVQLCKSFRWIVVCGAFLTMTFLEACTDDVPTIVEDPDAFAKALMGTTGVGLQIVIEPHWLTLDTIGVTGALTATVLDADGDAIDDATVTWASADTAIATIHATGVVTSVAFGSTKVSATYNSATAEVTVEVARPLADREILEILYRATDGDNWTNNTNWLTDADLSQWHGVRAYRGKVSSLSLRENNLAGTIPPELGGLDELRILYLGENRLSGPIPPELSKFRRLRDLFLSGNAGISGRLPPELGFTGGLEYLGVGGTNLSGLVPRTFANLELQQFYFDTDRLCIPSDLEAWLTAVPQTVHRYSVCSASINIDPSMLYFEAPPLGDTARLQAAVFNAERDTVYGATIVWASEDTAIATVDSTGLVTAVDYGTTRVTATSDSLTATAEVEIVFTLSDRQVLDSIFQLNGGKNWTDTTNWLSSEPLSEWYGVETNAAGKVAGLLLDSNGLTGSIPGLVADLEDLVTLDLSGNDLTGNIPGALNELQQLRDLVLDGNALEGLLPPGLGNMAGLRYLNIVDNKLSGVVPRTFANLALDTLYAGSSGVCLPPSLDEWFAAIEQTDDAARCVASISIDVVDLPSLTFYATGETARLAAAYTDAEGDTIAEAPVAWSSGNAAVASVHASGTVTAVGSGTTEVTATYRSVTASVEVEVALPQNDTDVLEILYDRTIGKGWTDGANWLTDAPLSEWAGVETDEHGRVVGLSLPDNNLRGRLHSSIGQLDRLVTLDLSRNWITGPLPAELGNLHQLRELVLGVNGFSGSLPWQLGNLEGLRTLHVAVTSLSGLIPAYFANLELDSFRVGGTQLCTPPSLAAWIESIRGTDDPPQCVATVSIQPSSLTFSAAGDTARLSVAVVGADGRVVESAAVSWESGDRTVARVDATGLVTARASGIAAVTARYDSTTAGTADVAVKLSGSDRAALEALYRATGGDDWKDNTNWLSDEPLEKWHGVSVGNGRVDRLDLFDNDLDGQIPAAIGLLENVYMLDLGNNNAVVGPIPPAIGRLRHLRDLNLRDTRVDGPVPSEMGSLTRLRYLSLSYTNLSGPLPATFSNLNISRFYHAGTGLCVPRSLAAWYEMLGNRDPLPCIPETKDRKALTTLYHKTGGPKWRKSRNWMTERSLNTWQGVTTDQEGYVTEIFLPWNRITGSIPPELGDLARLERLALYGNKLTRRIPPELGKLANVRRFSFSSNELEGPIPPELGGMVRADTIYLSGNELSGPIPPEIGKLENLLHLALFDNELSGPLPAEFGNLKKLRSMWLVDNKIDGQLPPELGDMTSLEVLSLSRNAITGGIPRELGKLQALKQLELGDNQLTGPIPPELGNITSLEELLLQRNALSGAIPPELGKLSNLELMWIFGNELSGPIPAELGNLSKLERLGISRNRLTGPIPPELGQLSALKELHFGGNSLTGPIPPELGNLKSVTYLALFDNKLSGRIPGELGDLTAVRRLVLADNRLSGPIPPELGKLSTLDELHLRG
ncbi:MAG: hypothetical protein F4X00_06965, partial [Gemmatimonadetes bacterium]|nr:hypothetical protein [Gemmatimonadota bacterium]